MSTTAKLQPTACVLSTIKHLKNASCSNSTLLLPQKYAFFFSHSHSHDYFDLRMRPGLRGRRNHNRLIVAMSSSSTANRNPNPSPLKVCVKASATSPDKLGDCPFSQRVLLTLEEKHLPYDLKLVDFADKPEWFVKINPEGKVPLMKFGESWIADSDVITQSLEEKYPNPPLKVPLEKASVGSRIFSTFIGFLKSKDSSDGTEQVLLNELSSFNDYIKENGPFVNGKDICAVDLALGPKLYHLEIALGHYKKWSIPDSLSHVKSYMKNIFSLDSFIKTRALPEDVIVGWRPKVMGA